MPNSMNLVVVVGRVGRDPETRKMPDGKTHKTVLHIATSTRWKDKKGEVHNDSQWHYCECWSPIAEAVDQYVRKGDFVAVRGSLRTNTWVGKDGNKRYQVSVKADDVQFLGGSRDGGGRSHAPRGGSPMRREPSPERGDPPQELDDRNAEPPNDLPPPMTEWD